MALLNNTTLKAIVALVDIALHERHGPVNAKSMTARFGVGPRAFEPVLQALAAKGLIDSRRGPLGGYKIARAGITIDEIFHAVEGIDDEEGSERSSELIRQVMLPMLVSAEAAYLEVLRHITVEQFVERARRAEK